MVLLGNTQAQDERSANSECCGPTACRPKEMKRGSESGDSKSSVNHSDEAQNSAVRAEGKGGEAGDDENDGGKARRAIAQGKGEKLRAGI
jgi:hypothetical protein